MHYVRTHTHKYAQSCQSDLKTVVCKQNSSRHPKGWTAESKGQIGWLSHSYGAYFTSHVRSSWQIPSWLSTSTNWIMSNLTKILLSNTMEPINYAKPDIFNQKSKWLHPCGSCTTLNVEIIHVGFFSAIELFLSNEKFSDGMLSMP